MSEKIKIPGPPVGYTDLMDYEITKKLTTDKAAYKDGTKKRYFPLRPSASGYCARKLAYQLMEYYGYADYDVPINSPTLHRLFSLGHSVEYSVLNIFKLVTIVSTRYKQALVTCFKLKPATKEDLPRIIEGSCDACFISDKYKCVMDVKSAKDRFSKAYKTNWTETLEKFSDMDTLIKLSDTAFYADDIEAFLEELGEDFLLENIVQLNLYACTNFMKERGIDHAVIYKYNKNDSRHYELRFKPSQKMADAIEAKFNHIHKCISKKKPEDVSCNYALGTMHCAFCDYAKVCRPNTNTLKEYFATWRKKKWPVDIKKVKESGEVRRLFEEFELSSKEIGRAKDIENKIINILDNQEIQKIKLDNTHVYELKLLKSPREHLELRRTKL